MLDGSPPFLKPVVYAGVDGGGSTCRVRVRDARGHCLAEAVSGAANVTLAFDAAVATVVATLGDALAQAGCDPSAIALTLVAGLAGVSNAEVAGRVAAALAGWGDVTVTSDAAVACAGAHAGADGGLVIAGTGSGAYGRLGPESFHIGGRGFLLGDDGSGARLGLDALRVALRAHDGLEPHSSMTRQLMARFGHAPAAVATWGRSAPTHAFADLAPLVLAAAREGDPHAMALVSASAQAIARLVTALRSRGVPRISLVGGLAGSLEPYLPAETRQDLCPALFDALDGALLLAGCPVRAARPGS